jgi:hypothetical protein
MKTIIPLIRPLVLTLLVLASFATTTLAQEVQIPDPGLNAAIREALEKPNGPLTELSETLAATNLAATVASLRNQGVSVFTYPLAIQLVRPRTLVGAFQFGITGPPGVYAVLGSTDLAVWSALGVATNSLGSINFTDVTANLSPQKFYRALPQ